MSPDDPVCEKCGGTVRRGVCNICVMLGQAEPPSGDATQGWPLHSDSLGTHPDQIPAEIEYAKKRGVRLAFDAQGRAILENRRHRREVMRLYGVSDKHSFSGH